MVGPVEGAAVGPVVDPAVAVVVAVAAVAAVIGQDRTGQHTVVTVLSCAVLYYHLRGPGERDCGVGGRGY